MSAILSSKRTQDILCPNPTSLISLHNTSIGFKEAGIWPFNPDAVLGVGADKEYSHLNEGASVGPQSGGEREDECGGDS